jgi:hypothetical protein
MIDNHLRFVRRVNPQLIRVPSSLLQKQVRVKSGSQLCQFLCDAKSGFMRSRMPSIANELADSHRLCKYDLQCLRDRHVAAYECCSLKIYKASARRAVAKPTHAMLFHRKMRGRENIFHYRLNRNKAGFRAYFVRKCSRPFCSELSSLVVLLSIAKNGANLSRTCSNDSER